LENDLHNDKYASQAMSSYLANSKLTPQVREEAKKRLLRNQYVKRLEAMEGNILESLSRSAPNERLEWARRILSRTEDPGNKDACSDICIDALFGLRTLDEEAALSKKGLELHEQHRGEKIWIQGHPESILTRYSIFRAVEEQLKPAPGSTFVDLGSGYGRLGFYLSAKRPDLRFIGYELLPDRVRAASAAAKELGLPENRLHFVEKNLGDPKFQPEPADYYYMFNPFSEKTLEKVMSDLQKISKSKRVRLVMMDYGLPPMLARQAPWLRKVERIETGSIPVVVYESI
jgi:SAM-dependent methyltransferase